jgi:hypothetical protein
MAPAPLLGEDHTRGGARLWRLTSSDEGEGRQYAPYFYNPHLDPQARHLLFIWRRAGEEQAWVLDREQAVATQVTEARGRDQCWAPYIKEGVDGIRPQFVCWSQPDWEHAVFWEVNALRRVHVRTLAEDTLYTLPEGRVPMVPHCSAGGWVAWGYLPAALQTRFREGPPLRQLLETDAVRRELAGGRCGFMVYDLLARRLVMDVSTPFWPNHVQASPDNHWVLFCQEGPWDAQRMHLLHAATGEYAALRLQEGGIAIGHEFWMTPTRVGYHGSAPAEADGARRGFFGQIDVQTGYATELSSAGAEQRYGHYHASPDGSAVVTDGEVTAEWLSVAPLHADALRFEPVARQGWTRRGDQRTHPHPHWHTSGRVITCTGQVASAGDDTTCVLLADLPE